MLKKVLVGGFLLVMIGAALVGTVTLFAQRESADACTGLHERATGTLARQDTGSQIRPYNGRGRSQENRATDLSQGDIDKIAPQSGYGGGGRLGQGQGIGSESPLADTAHEIEGVVIETGELFIETDSGETVHVGLGPIHYRDGQGFALSIGDNIRVLGYWEDDEFKAVQVTNMDSGDKITLRDASGRPMWAGQGRGQNRG